MSKHLVRDLENLQRHILSMAGAVEDAIYKSTQAITEGSIVLAEEVISGDNRIDAFDNALTEECLKMMALHQPVAVDLRRIATVFMITSDLERMGDLAADIALRAVAIGSLSHGMIPESFGRMTDQTTAMVRMALDAFVNLDSKAARRVIRLDDEVDRFNSEIIDELMTRMKATPDKIDTCLSLFSAVRHLERIGDHATNIAEDVVYLVEGELVRHRHASLSSD